MRASVTLEDRGVADDVDFSALHSVHGTEARSGAVEVTRCSHQSLFLFEFSFLMCHNKCSRQLSLMCVLLRNTRFALIDVRVVLPLPLLEMH